MLTDIFISLLGVILGSFAGPKLTIDVLWDSAVFHTAHVPKPEQSVLSEQRVHGGEASTGKNLGVRHILAQADAKDAAKAFHLESVQLLLLLGVGCPVFSPLKEGTDYAGAVHFHFGWSGQLGVNPNVSGQ